MVKDNGGPAFPVPSPYDGSTRDATLRDYFAANAPEVPDMQTFPFKSWDANEVVETAGGLKKLCQVWHQESWVDRMSRWAFEYADAMLAERAKC